jgi:RNA polymerase sigma-70 factor, ECF subfamily
MVPWTAHESKESEALLRRAARGDARAWGTLLIGHEDRLRRMVAFRLDPRLRGRVDASDVVQDAYLEAADHREDYFRQAAEQVPVFLWLRGVLANKLLEVHRHHLGTGMRDAGREAPAPRAAPAAAPDATSAALVDQLSGHATGPGTAAARSEVKARLHDALGGMDPTDREVLALRHFEQLTNGEAAAVLGIRERAAAKRYVRALRRLKDVLSGMPGGLTEVRP